VNVIYLKESISQTLP